MIRKNPFWLTLKVVLLILILNFQFMSVQAQNEIPDSLITERLQFIKNTLDRDRVHINRWWYGWLGGYSAGTIAQGAVYFTSDDTKTRQNMALGAATTLLGAAGQFISPLTPGKVPKEINLMPDSSRTDRLAQLTKAETSLEESAKREKLALNWKNHVLTGAVNIGGGLITWLGFQRTVWSGIGYVAINSVITETQIWTQPTIAKRNYKKYKQKYLESDEDISYAPSVNWYLEAYPGGIGIKVVF